MPRVAEDPTLRFSKLYIPVTESGCWLWTSSIESNGYGRMKVRGRKVGAHRFSYLIHKGPIPPGLTLDHLCRVRCCVNPDHIEAVTSKINTLRGQTITAFNAQKTQCVNGHIFTQDGTYIYKNKRHCRACNRERMRQYTMRRKTEIAKLPKADRDAAV